MLNIQLKECSNCINIYNLISEIDDKLYYYTQNQSNNISLMLSLDYNIEVIGKLLRYKSILTHRLYNPNYACGFPLSAIVNKIKILISK